MKKILKFFLPFWWQLLILFGTTCVGVWSSLQLPSIMADIVNNGIVGQDINYIWKSGAWMLVVTLIGSGAIIVTGFLASRVATGFSRNLRAAVFAKILSFGQTEINKFSTASLITRSTNDITQLERTWIITFRMCLQAPIMAVGAIWNAWQQASGMTWTIGTGVAGLFAVVIMLFIFVLPKFQIMQKLVDKLNLVSRENLTGLRVIRAFNNEKYEEKKFEGANRDIMKTQLFVNRMMSLMQPLVSLIFNGMLLLIIWIGAGAVAGGTAQIGNVMAFMQYAGQIMMSFMFLAMLMVFLPRAAVSAGRLSDILKTEPSIKFAAKSEPFDAAKTGQLEFRDVTFSYPDAETPILNDINFVAKPGETTAFIGSTGSGKSTLINLIPRFYDVSAGEILLDGVDIRKLTSEDLIAKIGYVPQKGVLFSGTVESNVKYGAPDISQPEVARAATVAQADFIKNLDGGFEHRIAQGGDNVSGGQKQRLSIARALAKNPEILIFDDSFSALDYKTDANLREALKPISRNKTTLIVAQRISTIKQAEQIIVLDDGEIVGRGTHYELLNNCEVYREIARSQFSENEMAAEFAAAESFAKKPQNQSVEFAKNNFQKSAKNSERPAKNLARNAKNLEKGAA